MLLTTHIVYYNKSTFASRYHYLDACIDRPFIYVQKEYPAIIDIFRCAHAVLVLLFYTLLSLVIVPTLHCAYAYYIGGRYFIDAVLSLNANEVLDPFCDLLSP